MEKERRKPGPVGKYGEPTRVVRVPVSVTDAEIDRLIAELKAERKAETQTKENAK